MLLLQSRRKFLKTNYVMYTEKIPTHVELNAFSSITVIAPWQRNLRKGKTLTHLKVMNESWRLSR